MELDVSNMFKKILTHIDEMMLMFEMKIYSKEKARLKLTLDFSR